MNEVIPFDFDGQPVRVVLDDDGTEWFVGRDVATILGYSRPHDAIRKRCKGASIRRPLANEKDIQETVLIREPDVFRLIIGSRLPAAERFEAWLFEEVLPELRRTGRYALTDADEPEDGLPENGRAQRLVDAGRVFGAVSRILRTAETLPPERLETALSITRSVADVDLRGLLESGGWQVPVLEALPPNDEMVAMGALLEAWHEALGPRAVGAGELLEEIRAMQSDEGEAWRPLHPALAEAAARALGPTETWGVRELGYRLRAWSGRIVNGLRLVSDGKGKQGVRWRVRAVKTATTDRQADGRRVH